eukprot:6352474-Pyramimonas_sp.AAC.1
MAHLELFERGGLALPKGREERRRTLQPHVDAAQRLYPDRRMCVWRLYPDRRMRAARTLRSASARHLTPASPRPELKRDRSAMFTA